MKNQTPPSTMSMLETLEYYGADKVDPNELYAALAEAEEVRDVLEGYDLDPKDLKAELERLYDLENSLKEVKEELLDAVEVLREIRDYDSDDLEDRDDARWALAHDWLKRNNK